MADWASGASPGADDERFARAEQEASRLRQELAAGRISGEQLRARLQELMIQDERGVWWAVGQHSGEWYRNQGGQWVRDVPPPLAAARAGVPPMAESRAPLPVRPAPLYPAGRRQPHRAAALMVSLICLLVLPFLAYSCGRSLFASTWHSNPELGNTYSILLFLLAGIVGVVITFRVAGRWWRGE